jgi:hypothetical protein
VNPQRDHTASPELLADRHEVEQVVAGESSACVVNALLPPVFRGEGITSYSCPNRVPSSINAP